MVVVNCYRRSKLSLSCFLFTVFTSLTNLWVLSKLVFPLNQWTLLRNPFKCTGQLEWACNKSYDRCTLHFSAFVKLLLKEFSDITPAQKSIGGKLDNWHRHSRYWCWGKQNLPRIPTYSPCLLCFINCLVLKSCNRHRKHCLSNWFSLYNSLVFVWCSTFIRVKVP